jgi:cation diffusion facilitator CzcD-associated flavoprotein CzcO
MADVDVLIVGAGVSGIGAAWHLRDKQPHLSYLILEARDAIGGTWDLFRYPGIRSDSDLHTFAYAFKPWTSDEALADGPSILSYVREVAAESGIDGHIRFGHRVERAEWSPEHAEWRVSGDGFEITARWLFSAAGYYRYDDGYTPELPGIESFAGPVVHPQHWPEDLEYEGRRVLVIGSGATAMTLVPALAERARVTMLQRSPTYVLAVPARDALNGWLRRRLGDRRAYRTVRAKNIALQALVYRFCRRFPRAARRVIRAHNRALLPEGFPVDVHFNPRYDPWDQRLCIVPDGDLFHALGSGRARIVTDEIEAFTRGGVRLRSGEELEADVVVTATGLNLQLFGGIDFVVDGQPVDLSRTIAYKGMMLSGVPNFVFAVGYTNASWTLKVDLVCEHFCRLLAEAAARGSRGVVPVLADPAMETEPLLDFKAGYVQRSLHLLPRQGSRAPWQLAQNYWRDVRYLRRAPLDDGALSFL